MPERGRRESFAERRARRAEVDDPELVLAAAARFLETRSRSVAEVRRRLTTAGYRNELVESAIGRLTELGVLDDAAFAVAWVESRDRARPRGAAALRRELALKGVPREIVEGVLEARAAGADADDAGGEGSAAPDEAAAWRLLERRGTGLLRERDPRLRRQKAYALLARNGFDPATCAEVATAWTRREGDNVAELEDGEA